jgi:hypothetical protein
VKVVARVLVNTEYGQRHAKFMMHPGERGSAQGIFDDCFIDLRFSQILFLPSKAASGLLPHIVRFGSKIFVQIEHLLIILVRLFRLLLHVVEQAHDHQRLNGLGIFLADFFILLCPFCDRSWRSRSLY